MAKLDDFHSQYQDDQGLKDNFDITDETLHDLILKCCRADGGYFTSDSLG